MCLFTFLFSRVLFFLGGNSNHSNSNTRLTRSRANQGTPGPGDQANDSPRKYF